MCNLILIAAIACAQGGFVVAERGASSGCAIEVRASYESSAYAANELADYAEKLTGTRPTVGAEGERKIVLVDDDISLGTDGFEIVEKDGTLTIRGGKRGLLYGVYELLERFGGVAWYASWHEVVPKIARLEVPKGFFTRQLPAFELREPFWYDANHNPAFAARIRKNNALWSELPEKFGGQYMQVSRKYRGHTFDLFVPPKEFGTTHPEYFSEIKGRRKSNGRSQLCLSNPEVAEIVTTRLREQMRKEREAKVFSLTPNDWYDYCQCEKCAAISKEEGTEAGPYVRFVNKVAEALVDEFPDRKIRAGAYQWYRRPPKKFGRYAKNVLCSIAPIECDFSAPIATGTFFENVETAADVAKWGKIATGGMRVFDYATAFREYPFPFPNVKVMRDNLIWYRRNNVKYVINEGDHNGLGGSFAELKAWLGGKLMWNPDQEVEPLVDQFMNGFYGKAAPHVKQYFKELEALPRYPTKEPLCCEKETAFSSAVDDAFLWHSLELWDKAEAAVAGDKACLRNVKLGKFSVVYSILRRQCPKVIAVTDFSKLTRVRGLAKWVVSFMESQTRRVAFAENIHDGTKTGRYDGWKRLALEGEQAVTKGVVEESVFELQLPGDWVSIKDDPTASQGKAACIEPRFWAWCLQLQAKDVLVDDNVAFKVKVRARVDFRKDATKNGIAFVGGFSTRGKDSPRRFQRKFKTSEVSDKYEWYEIGQWTANESDNAPYFWLSLGQFDRELHAEHPEVSAVWVDQIAFERVK